MDALERQFWRERKMMTFQAGAELASMARATLEPSERR
jgi:hypothetical protein